MLFSATDRLFRAIEKDETEKAIDLIKKTGKTDCRDSAGNTPLIAACSRGNMAVIRELIECGADVNAVNSENESSLLAASKNGHLETISYLLDNNADIEIRDNVGYGVLHAAAGFGHLAVLEILLPRIGSKDSPDAFGNTPLIYAAMYGHYNIVEFLLQNGADPDAQNVNGSTPLMEAAADGHRNTVEVLLRHNARPDLANIDGILPHVMAYNNEHYEISSVISLEAEKRSPMTDGKEELQPGFMPATQWLDSFTGKAALYTVTRQTIVGDYDSRDEGKKEYHGILKKEGGYSVYSENLDRDIPVDGFPRYCREKSLSLSWQDYRTYGVLLEKTIKFDIT